MGLGSTTKKIQLLAERAEQMYKQVGELRDQINELRDTVEATGRKVDTLEKRDQRQWLILQELAKEQGIDVDVVLAEASIETAEVPSQDEREDAKTDEDVAGEGEAQDTDDATSNEED